MESYRKNRRWSKNKAGKEDSPSLGIIDSRMRGIANNTSSYLHVHLHLAKPDLQNHREKTDLLVGTSTFNYIPPEISGKENK